mgnify:CR=1 FL=1
MLIKLVRIFFACLFIQKQHEFSRIFPKLINKKKTDLFSTGNRSSNSSTSSLYGGIGGGGGDSPIPTNKSHNQSLIGHLNLSQQQQQRTKHHQHSISTLLDDDDDDDIDVDNDDYVDDDNDSSMVNNQLQRQRQSPMNTASTNASTTTNAD